MGNSAASTTARRLYVSSLTEDQDARTAILRLLGQLADPVRRSEAAHVLAHAIGAEILLVFLLDPDVGRYLPAPGFVQTLPDGRRWQSFLRAVAEHGRWSSELPFPDRMECRPAIGLKGEQDALLVLLGGTPQRQALDEIVILLPLLAAALRSERLTQIAQAQVVLLRGAATDAQTLAAGLEAARRDLQRMYGEVRAALRDRDSFLASVTHDLKTPLTAIYGHVQLLRRQMTRANPSRPERLLEGLRQVESTALRMRRQIDQLLDVARLQMGQPLELDRRPTDLMALVQAVGQEQGMSSGRHQVFVVTSEERLVGHWDALRLECLLENLLSNAVKYSPAGGEVHVTVREEVVDDVAWAVIAVRDFGIGVPPAELPRIFDRFYRAGNTTGQMLGSGIGLASARQIVQEHGGTITVESTLGQGSIFTVRLPISTGEDGGTREQ